MQDRLHYAGWSQVTGCIRVKLGDMCLDWRVERGVGDASSHRPTMWLAPLFTGGSDGERQPGGT